MTEGESNAQGRPALTPDSHSAPAFATATEPSYTHNLFFGPDGLRPGWGFAFYVVTFYLLNELAEQLVSMHDFGASGLWSQLLEEAGRFVSAVIPALVLARVERRAWGNYGLPLKQLFGKRFWTGAVWGIAAISVLMLALRGVGSFHGGSLALHGLRIARFAAFWALMFLVVGLFEEFLLRGYTQFTLTRGIGFWPAAIILSCGFGLIHLRNYGESLPGVLAAAWIGLFFCLTLRRTGSLWFAVGFHAAWDWGETFLYSVPDSGLIAPGHLLRSSLTGPDWLSGGEVGPEGSVFCFAVIAVAWIIFALAYPKPAFVAGSQSRETR
jgi:uncharacterized protein